MATYSFTLAPEGRQRVGKQHVVTGTLTASGNYTTGGDTISPALFGLGSIESLSFGDAFNTSTNALPARYVPSTGKIMHFRTGAVTGNPLDEVANATSIADYSSQVTVWGR